MHWTHNIIVRVNWVKIGEVLGWCLAQKKCSVLVNCFHCGQEALHDLAPRLSSDIILFICSNLDGLSLFIMYACKICFQISLPRRLLNYAYIWQTIANSLDFCSYNILWETSLLTPSYKRTFVVTFHLHMLWHFLY